MPSRRILFCNYEFPPLGGGGGTCSKYLAGYLAAMGHRVEVVTAHHRGLARDVRAGNLRLRRLSALRRRRGQSNPLEMASYACAAFPYLLLRWARRPDVIVSFHSIPSGLPAWPLSMIWGVPHIVLFRGGDVPGWLPGELDGMHRRTLWLNRLIVYQAAAALANSDGLRDLAQPSFPRKEIGVLRNGVDLRAYRPPPGGRGGRTGPVRLIFAGRITTQKGIDTLLRALAGGALRPLDWVFDLVGDGPQLGEYLALAEKLGIGSRVVSHGWLGRSALRGLYQEADLLVFPSRYEGMPNVVLEAGATGLPTVATRIAGTEEIIVEGENGFLVEVDDEAGLAARIADLVTDERLRLRLGKGARRLAIDGWSWPGRARQLEAVIEEVLRGRGRAG